MALTTKTDLFCMRPFHVRTSIVDTTSMQTCWCGCSCSCGCCQMDANGEPICPTCSSCVCACAG